MQFDNEPKTYDRPLMAYRYSYGRKAQYGSLPSISPSFSSPTPQQPYSGSSDPRRIFFSSKPKSGLDDGPQTVEQILRHGFMNLPAGDSVTGMLEDKRHTSWLGLDDILDQIHERDRIYRENMEEILWSECYAFNDLARQGWPAEPKQWELYQKRLADLGAQQRMERISAWQDISRLRQLLPESMQEYLSASRKGDLLNNPEDDAL